MIAEDFLNVFTQLGLCEKTEKPDRGIKVRYDFLVEEGNASVADLTVIEELADDVSHVEISQFYNNDEEKSQLNISFNIKDDEK